MESFSYGVKRYSKILLFAEKNRHYRYIKSYKFFFNFPKNFDFYAEPTFVYQIELHLAQIYFG